MPLSKEITLFSKSLSFKNGIHKATVEVQFKGHAKAHIFEFDSKTMNSFLALVHMLENDEVTYIPNNETFVSKKEQP